MIHIVLIKPEIPPNTGNIIRLCANTGYYLHLVKPLGFDLSDRNLIRAGLDYHDLTKLQIHNSLNEFINLIKPNRIFGATSKSNKNYTKINFKKNDAILFGSESIGLDQETLDSIPKENIFKLPMVPNNRSLNLSNATAVIIYESWKQLNFEGSI